MHVWKSMWYDGWKKSLYENMLFFNHLASFEMPFIYFVMKVALEILTTRCEWAWEKLGSSKNLFSFSIMNFLLFHTKSRFRSVSSKFIWGPSMDCSKPILFCTLVVNFFFNLLQYSKKVLICFEKKRIFEYTYQNLALICKIFQFTS